MAPFRRVAGELAGPAALGILVPPGRRTFIILRPRALEVDLLLLEPNPRSSPPPFLIVGRHEATDRARELYQALEAWFTGGPGRADVLELESGTHGIRMELGKFTLLACPREPGQPYRPLTFPEIEEARRMATTLAAALRPGGEGEQEVYFNTQHFSH